MALGDSAADLTRPFTGTAEPRVYSRHARLRAAYLLARLHFAPDDATRSRARVGRGGLHLLPHRPRRARAHHRLGAGLRRALAALFWPLVPAAERHRHADRVESSTVCRAGDGVGRRRRRPAALAILSSARP